MRSGIYMMKAQEIHHAVRPVQWYSSLTPPELQRQINLHLHYVSGVPLTVTQEDAKTINASDGIY